MQVSPPQDPSGPHLRTIAMPRDANPSGATFAAKQAQGRVATVSIDAMELLRPIAVGDEVSCYCSLVKAGETSLKVRIETWASARTGAGEPEKVTEGTFTFVAIDENGKPRCLGS